jgi:hypothetical protein
MDKQLDWPSIGLPEFLKVGGLLLYLESMDFLIWLGIIFK